MSTDPREIVIKLKATAEAVGFSEFKRQLQDAKRAIDDASKAGGARPAGPATGLSGAVQSAVSQATAAGIDPATAQQLINQTLGTSTRAAARRTSGTPTTASVAAVTGGDDGGDDFEAARTRARILSQRLQASGQTTEERAAQRLERRRNARSQTGAEDQAREQGRAFSNVRTGRQVGALPDEQFDREFADLLAQEERENATRAKADRDQENARTRARVQSQRQQASAQGGLASRVQRRAQTSAEDEAREQGRAFSNVRTGRQVGELPDEQLERMRREISQQVSSNRLQREREARQTVQTRAQNRAEYEARSSGNAFSVLRTGRQVGDLPGENEGANLRAEQQRIRAADAEQRAARKRIDEGQKVIDSLGDQGDEEGGGGGRRGGGAPGGGAGRNRSFIGGLLPSTPESVVRLAGALTGLQLGLDVVAGAARRLHEFLQQAIDTEVQMERETRSLAATVGGQASNAFVGAANRFVGDQSTRGTRAEFLQTAEAAQTLNQEYGVSQQQIEQVITASGRLARIHGVELPQAEAAIQSAVQGNTAALNQFGISLTDSAGRIRGQGASYQELVTLVGRSAASQIILSQTLEAVGRQQINSKINTDALATSMDRLGRSGQNVKELLGGVLAGPVTAVASGLGNIVGAGAPRQGLEANPLGAGVDAGTAASLAEQGQRRLTDARRDAVAVIGQEADALRALVLNAGRAAASLTAVAERQGRLSQIGSAVRGRDFLFSESDRAVAGRAAAGEDLESQGEQRIARDRGTAFRRQLVDAIGIARDVGPNAFARAQQDLVEFDRRSRARTAQTGAQEASRLGSRAGADAQSRLQTLAATDQQRQLNAAQQVADLRTETLSREGGIVELQRQQADLADQMRVAQRENLDLVLQETAARQAALAPANQLATVQFNQRRALLEIQARRQDVRLGVADPSTLSAIPDLRQQLRTAVRQTPRAELNDLLAQRQVQLQEQRVTADQLSRTVRVTGIEGQQRVVEDQLTPLQQAQRLTDQRTTDLNRQLELAQLAETAERTAAEQAALAASEVVNASDAAARRAEEWAASINDGLTDLQRAQGILAGLGNQGISPTTNNVNAQIVINGAGDPAEVARQVLALLNGTATATRAASVTQDRHGH